MQMLPPKILISTPMQLVNEDMSKLANEKSIYEYTGQASGLCLDVSQQEFSIFFLGQSKASKD